MSDVEWYEIATPYTGSKSGMVTIKLVKSLACYRGSHSTGNAKRKCKGYIGKAKKIKCECSCHMGET